MHESIPQLTILPGKAPEHLHCVEKENSQLWGKTGGWRSLVSKIGKFSTPGKVQLYKFNGMNEYLMMNINNYFNYLSNQFVHLSVT